MEDTPSGRPSGGRGMMPIGLVALAAIVYSLAPGGGTSRRDAGGNAAQERRGESPPPEEDPLAPVYQFLDVRTGKPVSGSLTRESELIPQYRVQFVIATLPDPVDSHLAQLFDRGVGAIAGSLQEGGFVLDRFSLPWKRDSSTRWDLNLPDRKESGKLVSLSPKSISSDLHRRMPGTILFRADDELVVVFLVGETPTSGIQREALSSALRAVETFQEKVGPQVAYPESDQVKILGPYFSGTTASLRNALIAWAKTSTRRVRIVSGSATVDSNYVNLNIPPQISFQATVIPDNVLKWHLFDFLKEELGAKLEEDVALFVEGGTSYGSNFAKKSTPDHLEPRFVISFPLHVSQLRAAYERDEALRNPGGASRAPRHSLELALDSPDQDSRDVLRAQDPGTALNIADLVISHSIETIRREGIRFVGILASDPRDVLFLSRKIREAGASVTLFTFGTDILLTHSDYERYLRGMLVVSPYPLFPVNQAWTGTAGARLAFPGASEEGIYNAVQYLVGRTPSATQPGSRPRLVEYRRPNRPGPRKPRPAGADQQPPREPRPPIWIMAVGRGGFWPVNFIPRYTSSSLDTSGSRYASRELGDLAKVAEAYVLKDPTEPESSEGRDSASQETRATKEFDYHPPGAVPSFLIIEIVFVVLILVYVFVRLPFLSRVSPQLEKRLSIVCERILGVKDVPDAIDANQTYLVCAAILLATVQAAVFVTLVGMKAFFDEHRPALVVSLLVLLCLVGIAGRDLVGLSRRAREEGGSRPARLGVVVALVYLVGALFIVLEYVLEVRDEGWSETLASYARTLDLTSGISPVLPFLFAILVLCLWVACNLQRAFLLEVHGNAWPSAERTTLAGFRDIYESIQSLLADPVRRFAMVLVPLVVLLPASRVFSHFDTIDGDHWSGVWLFLFLACFVSILYAVALFLALWVRLRRFLRRLAWHPAAEAFRRLPEALGTTPWRMWRTLPSLTALEASVSQLRLIVNSQRVADSEPWKTLRVKALRLYADQAAELLTRAFTAASTSFAASLPAQRELRQLLAKAFDLVVEELEDVWARWPGTGDRIEELRRAGAKEQFLDVAAWVRKGIPAPVDVWFRAAEEFFAIRMSSVIRYVFLQMKNLLSFSFLGFIFLLAAINAYPFEPFHSVMALIWVIGVVGLTAIGWVLIGMNRDRVLSYIGKTKPGEVSISAEFVTTMTIYIIVPLLTLLATQFPGIGDFVFSVFTPAIRSVR